jgi:hypothetical protein
MGTIYNYLGETYIDVIETVEKDKEDPNTYTKEEETELEQIEDDFTLLLGLFNL